MGNVVEQFGTAMYAAPMTSHQPRDFCFFIFRAARGIVGGFVGI
jgi:hypothetical protein